MLRRHLSSLVQASANIRALDAEKLIPRYLYRTIKRTSKGINTEVEFGSWAVEISQRVEKSRNVSSYKGFLRSTFQEGKQMIENHLQWTYCCSDDFTSWTSSLRFALQHAIREDNEGKQNVRICILDTWKLETKPFYPATLLLKACNISNTGKLRHEFFTTEFLLIGKLEVYGCCGSVSLSDLIDGGIFEVLPQLNKPKGKGLLVITLNNIRSDRFGCFRNHHHPLALRL